jgi:hypothetical protein
MPDAIAPRTPWLAAIAFAFALLVPWHTAGAAQGSADDFASPPGSEHRTDCPLFASHKQAAPAQARKAAPAQPEATADFERHDRADVTAALAARPHGAWRAAVVSPVPIYLVNLSLLR